MKETQPPNDGENRGDEFTSEKAAHFYNEELEEVRWTPTPEMRRLFKHDLSDIATLPQQQARWMVHYYYMMQGMRIRSRNQVRALGNTVQPHRLLNEISRQARYFELNLKACMLAYAASQRPGRWMMHLRGIGPILAATLLAYIDISNKPTVGHLWRYAGLDPTNKWYGSEKAKEIVMDVITDFGGRRAATGPDGNLWAQVVVEIGRRTNRKPERLYKVARWFDRLSKKLEDGDNSAVCDTDSLIKAVAARPWNAKLKQMCWHVGECFIKVGGMSNPYTRIIYERKALEKERNERGANREAARQQLEEKNYGKATAAYAAYSSGRLPDRQVHARARRYGVKLFLAHLHHVMWWERFNKPPVRPYILEHSDGKHTRMIEVPNFPFEGLGAESGS